VNLFEILASKFSSSPHHKSETVELRAGDIFEYMLGLDMKICTHSSEVSTEEINQLSHLLADSISQGSSIGFLNPTPLTELGAFWRSEFEKLHHQSFIILARLDNVIVGTVIISREQRANGRHRAELRKLMVASAHQRKGIGSELEQKACLHSRQQGITLLYLDSATDFLVAETYEKWGWTRVGSIPNYATDASGSLVATTYFYKEL
jgi:GNAT superfamily N-acetyltransferase